MDKSIARWSARDLILEIDRFLQNRIPKEDQLNLDVKHHFAKGVYIRECLIPRGVIAAGKIHKFQIFNVILRGDISVFSEEFGITRYVAPLTFISKAGAKRIVYANEDTVWLTVHQTNKTDLAEIEDEVIAKDYSDPVLIETLSDVSLLEAL